MTRILGIDPGNTTSGVVIYDSAERRVLLAKSEQPNARVMDMMWPLGSADHCAIECFNFQAQGVGDTVFETCYWIGEFRTVWRMAKGTPARLIKRGEVVRSIVLEGRKRDDAAVRGFLIEMLGAPGTKAHPGPTYGVTGHAWQALAVAVVAAQQLEREGT